MFPLFNFADKILQLWVTFLAETSKDLEIILIIIVLSFTNRLSRTSLYLSLKTSFVYSNLFSLAKTSASAGIIEKSREAKKTYSSTYSSSIIFGLVFGHSQ